MYQLRFDHFKTKKSSFRMQFSDGKVGRNRKIFVQIYSYVSKSSKKLHI